MLDRAPGQMHRGKVDLLGAEIMKVKKVLILCQNRVNKSVWLSVGKQRERVWGLLGVLL